MKIFSKRFPNERFPPLFIQIYYLMISITFCYLYYHRFVDKADFYRPDTAGGVLAVAAFDAFKPIQYRIFVPLFFKLLSLIIPIANNLLFFLIIIIITFSILIAFYLLLNVHFKSESNNRWLSTIIIYPMIWNLLILNGQFFYMDFTLLLFMIIGYYFIVINKSNWLLVVFILGVINHPSIIHIILFYLLFNYKRIFSFKIISYALAMFIIFITYPFLFDILIKSSKGGNFLIFNYDHTLYVLTNYPRHVIIRDIVLNFGGLHFLIILLIISGLWRKFSSKYLYIHIALIPYLISIPIFFSIEEIRNYNTIIPFVLILALMFLSTFPNSFIKPVDVLLRKPKLLESTQ